MYRTLCAFEYHIHLYGLAVFSGFLSCPVHGLFAEYGANAGAGQISGQDDGYMGDELRGRLSLRPNADGNGSELIAYLFFRNSGSYGRCSVGSHPGSLDYDWVCPPDIPKSSRLERIKFRAAGRLKVNQGKMQIASPQPIMGECGGWDR